MTMTNFPNGLTSFGVPLFGGGPGRSVSNAPGVSIGVQSVIANTWFIDTVYGADGNDGLSPQSPLSTMATAFARLRSGDVINFRGKIQEQLVTPVQVFDVWINGLGNRPRHADATPSGGRPAAAQWAPPASGAVVGQATCRVLQQGWKFTNFLMTAGDITAPCVELVRNAAAGDDERDASHAEFFGMRFSGAGIGIKSAAAAYTENVFDVWVRNCLFDNMTYGIKGLTAYQWQILGNVFGVNTNQIILALSQGLIMGNSIGPFTAGGSSGGIDLNGSAAGLNQVCWNNLSGTYSIAGGYRVGAASDNWYGNATSAGFSSADPA